MPCSPNHSGVVYVICLSVKRAKRQKTVLIMGPGLHYLFSNVFCLRFAGRAKMKFYNQLWSGCCQQARLLVMKNCSQKISENTLNHRVSIIICTLLYLKHYLSVLIKLVYKYENQIQCKQNSYFSLRAI